MSPRIPNIQFRASDASQRLCQGFIAVGIIALVAGFPLAPERAYGNILIGSLYLIGLGLGAMMFLACDSLLEGGWTAVFRRIPEAMGSLLLPAAAGVALVVLLAAPAIYPWITEPPAGPTVTALKQTWLTRPFFIVRALLYLAVWISLAQAWIKASRQQDVDGEVRHTLQNLGRSAGLLVAYSITIWLAGVDWIMSLEPEWFSTMIGVYQFAGLFLSGIAAMSLIVVWLGTAGPLRGYITANHYHDLGKLLFSFGCFWFYIWYSQYLIIWYTNMHEETLWYLPQMVGAWGSLFVLNLLLNWAVPFFVLLSGNAKRNPKILAAVAVTVLIGRWVDLYLMIGPPTYRGGAVVSFMEFGVMFGIVGVAGLVILRALQAAPLVPLHDPYMGESTHHHV